MRLFLEIIYNNRRRFGASALKSPLDSGVWGFAPNPVFITPFCYYNFHNSSVLALNVLLLSKKKQNVPISPLKHAVFVGGVQKYYFVSPWRKVP